MILGVGVDIVHLPRIAKLISKRGSEPLARRILSAREYGEFQARWPCPHSQEGNDDGVTRQRQTIYLGSRWCIKEAVYKALFPVCKLEWKQVTVIKEQGKPSLLISNASDLGVARTHVSLSHDGDYAIAQVVLETE